MSSILTSILTFVEEEPESKENWELPWVVLAVDENQSGHIIEVTNGKHVNPVILDEIREYPEMMESLTYQPGLYFCELSLDYYQCNHPLDPVEYDCDLVIKHERRIEYSILPPKHQTPLRCPEELVTE